MLEISKIIKKNKKLKAISLSENRITNKGVSILTKSLYDCGCL